MKKNVQETQLTIVTECKMRNDSTPSIVTHEPRSRELGSESNTNAVMV